MIRIAVLFVAVSAAVAAPTLRLETAAVVLQIAPGAAALPQTVVGFNIGDGTLSPAVSVPSDSKWVTASVGAQGACNVPTGSVACIAVQLTFHTSTLARGTYTTGVTVSSPGAIDAPQVITATVQVGAQPASVDQYIAPGTSTAIPLITGLSGVCTGGHCPAMPSASTQDGGNWLGILGVSGQGTFRFYGNYSIQLQPTSVMAPGTYNGTVAVAGVENRNIPVTMRVTEKPIATPSTKQIDLRVAQGGPPMTYPFLPYISLANAGLGTLSVGDVSATGVGIGAYRYADVAIVSVDPGTLAPGVYSDGSVTIQCNAANCPINIPVRLEIVPKGAPVVAYQGVVDNASFSPLGPIAPGDICIVRGEQLSQHAPASAEAAPLPTILGGTRVFVNGVLAPMFYSSAGQLAFQAPWSTATGTAEVQIERDSQLSNVVSVNVASRAPGIVAVTDAAYNLRDSAHPARAGETLIVWAIGLGATSPAVTDGSPAPSVPLATLLTAPTVKVASRTLMPVFAGLAPGSVGLYQVIVTLPADIGNGPLNLTLEFPAATSNAVPIAMRTVRRPAPVRSAEEHPLPARSLPNG